MTQDQFWAQLSQAMSDLDPEERQGLVFLHGYNVDFDAAAIRAAQIGYDLKVPGATAFFSWPSCGTVAAYPADESCIEASEPYIAEFLQDFVTKSGLSRVHLVAHSMGNRGLLRALQRLGTRLTEARAIPFGQIILAAPDIDAQVFSGLANLYPQFGERTTLYASPADRAVAISQWIHRYPRAGLTPPVTVVPGVDTIEVPHFNVFELLGHGYYAEAEALLHDMFDLIRRNAPPKDRQRLLATQTTSGHDYWIMSR
ncbi:MAG: alpha/beta hydrolase [Gemmataceae bacterium]